MTINSFHGSSARQLVLFPWEKLTLVNHVVFYRHIVYMKNNLQELIEYSIFVITIENFSFVKKNGDIQ